MSQPKKRPKSVKPKAVTVWCAVGSDGTPDKFSIGPTRFEAECKEGSRVYRHKCRFRPIHQFTLTPVRRKKR